MATNQKRGKGNKDGDKKSSKRAEDTPTTDEKKYDTPVDTELTTPTDEEQTPVEDPTPKPPTPEPVYEEPVLTKLIVESYEGDTARGLYDGEGEATFAGGHNYKGQFMEGMMHGQGIYRWADGVIYDGEFSRNQVTGKGRYRWPDASVYEGEVLTGLRHGFGTYRCMTTSYTGEWQEGKRCGKGRMDYDNGVSFYEGDWIDNVKHGWGTRCYPSGNIYQGMWFNNIRHGEGTMRWLDKDQMYTGQWENGIQHGMGQHIWFLRRKAGSQYPSRNMYDGEFVRGLRHGYGTFYYANGARYEGQWQDNMKHGKGKFIFKNGRIYEGVFERDHIVEFPNFEMDGMATPDLTQLRTRTPLPSDNASVHSNDSMNTYSPSFQLDVDNLLGEFAELDREEEAAQVIFVIMRHISNLRKIYTYYSGLGYEDSPDNTFVMNRMQFWRFLKDCKLHHLDTTLTDMDRALAVDETQCEDIHNPSSKVLFREFVNYLVILAFKVYHGELAEGQTLVLATCLSMLISDNILRYACSVGGYIYYETRRAVNALIHMDQAYEIYKAFCTPRKYSPYEAVLKMRQFLFMMQDLNLVNNDLTAKAIIDIFASDDNKVTDTEGAVNLELEICFLEFFESLVGCAQMYVTEAVVKDPSTPRPSTTMTQDQSIISIGSPSRGASQVGLDDGQDEVTMGASSAIDVETEDAGSPAPRSTSQLTGKTGEGHKQQQADLLPSQTNESEAGTVGNATGRHTEITTPKKSEGTVLDPKKSSSFVSGMQSAMTTDGHQAPLVQSMVSMGGQSLGEEEDFEEEQEEPLDEGTRQFNFWTHQVHIFFVRKFFPAAQKFILLTRAARQKLQDMEAKKISEERNSNCSPAPPSRENTSVSAAPSVQAEA